MRLSKVSSFVFAQSFIAQPDEVKQTKQHPIFSPHSCWEESWARWWEGQTHNNKYILLIVHCRHFSLSPPFCSPFTFLSPCACPHYLSLVYSITLPPVLMPSCLLVLIFIYRFSSFSLPFLCTDGTSQLASHSASCLTSLKVNALHSLSPLLWHGAINSPGPSVNWVAWSWQRVHAAGKEISEAWCYSRAIEVRLLLYAPEWGSCYGYRKGKKRTAVFQTVYVTLLSRAERTRGGK